MRRSKSLRVKRLWNAEYLGVKQYGWVHCLSILDSYAYRCLSYRIWCIQFHQACTVWDMNLYRSSGHARAVGQEVVIITVTVHKLVSACDNIYSKKKTYARSTYYIRKVGVGVSPIPEKKKFDPPYSSPVPPPPWSNEPPAVLNPKFPNARDSNPSGDNHYEFCCNHPDMDSLDAKTPLHQCRHPLRQPTWG